MRILSSRLIVLLFFLVYSCVIAPTVAADITQTQLDEINQLWQTSAHALTEVNCSSCHQDPETKQLGVCRSYRKRR